MARAVPQRRRTSRGRWRPTKRSTKESDRLAEGDYTVKVIKDHSEEKKNGEDDEDEGSGKKQVQERASG